MRLFLYFKKVKLNFTSLLKKEKIKIFDKINNAKYNSIEKYCSERVGAYELIQYAEDWKQIKDRYEYLEDILLHDYLNKYKGLTNIERVIASQVVKEIGDFYRKCYKVCNQPIKEEKQKEEKYFVSTPRTD